MAVWEKSEENWLKCNVDGAMFFLQKGSLVLVFVSVIVRVLLFKLTLWCSFS
jgi:hypothetical protein